MGRASSFPVIRLFCVGYIELIRGVPLITLLFMAKFILPLMVAQDGDVSLLGAKLLEMNDVVRAMAAITIFSSAYLAEIIRGGLQAVPRGQVEAAQADLDMPRRVNLAIESSGGAEVGLAVELGDVC